MSGYAYDADLWCENCVPADDSGCECGRTDHNPQCCPIDVCDSDDGEARFCGQCGVCIRDGEAERECLIDGVSGIYVPQRWANECAELWRGYDPADVAILKTGPDHEWYWDAWHDVLNSAECIEASGKRWTLEQDGDLFATRHAEKGDGKLTPHPYELSIDGDGIGAIDFATGRYKWASALSKLGASIGLNRFTESEAHSLHEAIESDDAWCPCLNPSSKLAEALRKLQSSLV